MAILHGPARQCATSSDEPTKKPWTQSYPRSRIKSFLGNHFNIEVILAAAHAVSTVMAEVTIAIADGDTPTIVTTRSIDLESGKLIFLATTTRRASAICIGSFRLISDISEQSRTLGKSDRRTGILF